MARPVTFSEYAAALDAYISHTATEHAGPKPASSAVATYYPHPFGDWQDEFALDPAPSSPQASTSRAVAPAPDLVNGRAIRPKPEHVDRTPSAASMAKDRRRKQNRDAQRRYRNRKQLEAEERQQQFDQATLTSQELRSAYTMPGVGDDWIQSAWPPSSTGYTGCFRTVSDTPSTVAPSSVYSPTNPDDLSSTLSVTAVDSPPFYLSPMQADASTPDAELKRPTAVRPLPSFVYDDRDLAYLLETFGAVSGSPPWSDSPSETGASTSGGGSWEESSGSTSASDLVVVGRAVGPEEAPLSPPSMYTDS